MRNELFTITIVGRPNVGKSALYNRVIGKRSSIVEDIEGVTRDSLVQETEIFGKEVALVDTGGIDETGKIPFSEEIRRQTKMAVDRSDAIIFVVDGQIGITLQDEEVARYLLKTTKPVYLAVNKVDNLDLSYEAELFYSLGFAEVFPVSAIHGNGVAELLEAATEGYYEPTRVEENLPKVAIVGRPNVGKSTLLNMLMGEARCIVSDIPGTTRDAIDQEINDILFIDTAGIRRKKAENEVLDKFARVRTEKAIERADVCILVLDAEDGLESQEKLILQLIEEKGKGCIIFLNKWDKIKALRMEHAVLALKERYSFLEHLPIIVGSAETGRNVDEIYTMIDRVYENLHKRITTGELNSFVERSIQINHPPAIQGKRLRIYYLTQVGIRPPHFVLFVNQTELMVDSYKRYLINQFYDTYDFLGCPIQFKLKAKKMRKQHA